MVDIILGVDKKDERRLKRALKNIPEKVFKRTVGKAANKSMTPVSRKAKKLAPKDSGDYRKSIGKKKKTYTRNKVVWVGVGPRKGKPNAYLGHLIEYGHRIVSGGTVARVSGRRAGRADRARDESRTGQGRVVGFVPPRPHLRPALRQSKAKVLGIYRKELHLGIETEARRV